MVGTLYLVIIFAVVANVKSDLVQKTIYIDTSGGKYYQVLPIDWFLSNRRINFKVQALEDAYFALIKDVHDKDPLFEIVIGAEHNTKCYIKKNNKIIASADTPEILDPASYKGFWISWHTDSGYVDLKNVCVVRIGHETDETSFMHIWDPDPEVWGLRGKPATAYYIGVRTNPTSGSGFWEIDVMYNETNVASSIKEVTTTAIPKSEPDYGKFYPIINQRIDFKVKISRDAWICLSQQPQKFLSTYQIVLGGWGNKKCVIKEDSSNKVVVNKECNGALNSEHYRGFWISIEYVEKFLTIGVGNEGEILPFMKYEKYAGNLPFYYSVACTGSDNQVGNWILKVAPPSLFKYVKTVQTMPVTYTSFDPIPKSDVIKIKTKATRDAWVGLTSSISNAPEYEIIIGGWNNAMSTIRKEGRDVAKFSHTALLETGTYYTGFWISVKQEKLMFSGVLMSLYLNIQVGQEDNETAFMDYQYDLDKFNPMQLKFYSVGSTLDTEYVEWVLEASVRRVDSVIPKFYITYENPEKYNLFALEGQRVEFEIKTAQNAVVTLTTSSHTPKIEVILENEVTKVYKDGSPLRTFDTYFRMSDEVYRGFWLDWKYINKPSRQMCLRLGFEEEVRALFEWCDKDPFLIKYIGVETRKGIGYWKFYDAWLESESKKHIPNLIQTYNNPDHYQFFPIARTPIRFSVKASRDAYLAFTSDPERKKPILEVLLGASGKGWSSQYTYIRKDFRRDAPAQIYTKTPDILKNDTFTGLWINWEYIEDYASGVEAIMKMQVGLEGETDPFMTWQGKDLFPINYVGVTGYKSSAVWIFEDDIQIIERKEWTEVTTYETDGYMFYPVVTKPLRIQVKASMNAYVALASARTENTFPLVECMIGTETNAKTIMLFNKNEKLAKYKADTIGVLSTSNYQSFWFDWNNFTDDAGKAKMTIYMGRSVDHNPFAFLTVDPFDINFFGLISKENTANWQFEEVAEQLPSFITTYNHTNQYQFYLAPNHTLKFYIKARSDAYIALSTTNYTSDCMYEIMIGADSNRKSYIKINNTIPQELKKPQIPSANTEKILSSTDLRGFWMDWVYRIPAWSQKQILRIRVGRQGEAHPFLRWHDTNPMQVKFIGFTGGNDKTLWKFEEVTEDMLPGENGDVVSIEPRAYDFSPKNYTQVVTSNLTYLFFSLPTQTMTLKVKSKSDVYIVLSSRPQMYSLFPYYEILIGGKNKYSWIKETNGNPKTIANTPLVLKVSEFRGFWISWIDGNIAVGFMDKVEPFMRWSDPDPIQVNFIGITSRYPAVWQITDPIVRTSNENYQFFPIANDKAMFLLKGSDYAKVMLTNAPNTAHPVMEIMMGTSDNTQITFRNNDVFYPKYVGALLDKNNLRGYWVSWALGKFTVGVKGEPHPLAFFDGPQQVNPNYLGFAGKNGSTTIWQFKVAPVWKPLQWDNNNDDPCFLDPKGKECQDMTYFLNMLRNRRPEDQDKRLINDCDSERWKNAFQCNKNN